MGRWANAFRTLMMGRVFVRSANYKGTITGLRFDPIPEGREGDEVTISSISWKPD